MPCTSSRAGAAERQQMQFPPVLQATAAAAAAPQLCASDSMSMLLLCQLLSSHKAQAAMYHGFNHNIGAVGDLGPGIGGQVGPVALCKKLPSRGPGDA